MECFSHVNIYGDYNPYARRFVECISFEWRRNSSAWGAKRSGHLQGPNPNVYLDIAKDLRECLMAAFTSNPSHVPFFKCDSSKAKCTYNLAGLVVGSIAHLK